jgi:hypothetical protein
LASSSGSRLGSSRVGTSCIGHRLPAPGTPPAMAATPIRCWLTGQCFPAERDPSSRGAPGFPLRCYARPAGPCVAGRGCVSGPPAGGDGGGPKGPTADPGSAVCHGVPTDGTCAAVSRWGIPALPIDHLGRCSPGGSPSADRRESVLTHARAGACRPADVRLRFACRAPGVRSAMQAGPVGQNLPHLQVGSPGKRGRGNG